MERLSSETVPIVLAAPAPRLRRVEEIPRVEALVNVAREEAVSVVVEVRVVVMVFTVKLLPAPPFRGLTVMFPVVAPPRVRVCEFVVPRFPAPVKKVALSPLAAEIVAVGVPVPTFMKANFAEAVDCPPIDTSTVEFLGKRTPSF